MRLTTFFALCAALLFLAAGAFAFPQAGKSAGPLPHYGPVVAQDLLALQPAAFALESPFAEMALMRTPDWLTALPAAGAATCLQQITVVEKPGQAPQISGHQTGNCDQATTRSAPPEPEARDPV